MPPMLENLQRIMRLQNIFGSGAMDEEVQPFMPEDVNAPEQSFNMGDFYSPETQSTDRFNTLLEQFPERNKPGMLRKLGASIIGLGAGPKAAEQALYAPFHRELEDWKEKIGPAQAGMTQERLRNVNERQLAYQTISTKLKEEAQEAKERNDTTNAKIRQQRADAYEFRVRNPDLKLVSSKGGNVFAIDPRTGEKKDTGIPSGSLTDADRLALIQEDVLERIEATGGQVRETEGVRQTGREKLAGIRGEEARKTKGTPSAAQSEKAETPTQTRVRTINKANEVKRKNPEWAKWIKIEGNNVEITPPSSGMFGRGPDKAIYDKIATAISGIDVKPSAREAKPPIKQAPKAPPGWKYVPKAGGGWTAVEDK